MIMTSAVLTCEMVKVYDRCHLLEGCTCVLAAPSVGEPLVDSRLITMPVAKLLIRNPLI